MACDSCGSARIVDVGAKCRDLFDASIGEKDYSGYVPDDLGIGGDDYVEFGYCLDCGKIQGKFPLATTELENGVDR